MEKGIRLLYITTIVAMCVVLIQQFYYRYAAVTGGIGDTFLGSIPSPIWILLGIQIILSLITMFIKTK